MNRTPVQIVEIQQDFCSLTYGSAPCTASLGATGADRCYNTITTCQDVENFDKSSISLLFGRVNDALPKDLYVIPSLLGVSTTPTTLNVGNTSRDSSPLGIRSTVSITLQDHPHSDRMVDPYRTQRSYIATDQGTFWTKWLARNRYYRNRLLKVYDGYEGQTLAEMTVRTYIIDSITGIGAGSVTIKGKDILRLADDDKAQAPKVSTGELIADINETATTLRVTGAVAADYPAPSIVRINDELITFSGVTTISNSEIHLTGCQRGQRGSEVDTHSAEDRVQICIEYTNQRVDLIAKDLLTTYGNVPAQYIDDTAWNAEADVWLSQFAMSAIISEPTGVTELLGELTEQAMFYIWWDERSQLINFRAIRPVSAEDTAQLDDYANIIEDSVSLTEKPDQRVSQVWIFWNIKDPTKSLTETSNYATVNIRANLTEEDDNHYGEQVIKKIYSRWITNNGQAINISARLLKQYIYTPRYMTMRIDAKDKGFWTGDLADVTHFDVVDFSGAPVRERWQIIESDEVESGHVIEYKLQRYAYLIDSVFGFWMTDNAPVFTSATEEEKAKGMWWSDENGKMSDGSKGYNWL